MHSPLVDDARHYSVVAHAIAFIRAEARNQPSLQDIAHAVHMSPHHLQRVFAQWAGISPKRFVQFLTKQYAIQQLAQSRDLLSVANDAGLSSPSRLHDLMVTCEALTPGEIKTGGVGVSMHYGFALSPFGRVLAAWTARGVCHFAFCDRDDPSMLAELPALWPRAAKESDPSGAESLMQQVFPSTPTRGTLHVVLRGTNFQIQVWQALLNTSFGCLVSYRQLARGLGMPNAQRAVGSAVAANRIGYLIPCHRVIRETGIVGPYRWGSERKLALLGWEASHAGPVDPKNTVPASEQSG